VIRPGRPGDVTAIGGLNASYRLELAAAGRSEERSPEAWRRWLDRRISAGDVRVAAEDDVVVGYIAWELRRLEQGRALAVRDLYVRPGERGLRHGAGLLARALDRARSDGVVQIEVTAGLDDEAARALVAGSGFERIGDQLLRRIDDGDL
jgi:L-amino acid N-acyltransferase YncA